MADLNGGRAVVELLKAEGVRYIFGIVGSTFLDVLDALYDDRAIEYINVRHEQAAAFMADGLARVTDLPGVCLVTSGPGATNLLTGVAAAHVAHSPVVVLVGGVALDHAQKDAFQEYDLVSMFKPVTKLALQITRPERIPDLLRAALRAAMTGRRGPVLVEIPRDVLSEPLAQAEPLAAAAYRVTHPLPPHPDAIRDAVRLLRQAERPLLIVGGGVNRAGAGDLVVRLSEQYGIPVITAYGRNDAVPNAHPLYVGPLGRAGAPEAAAACRRADLILVVGSRLAQFTTHFDDRYIRPGVPIVQIDVESRDIGRYYPVAVGIQADAREACQALLDALGRDARARAESRRGDRRPRRCARSGRRVWPARPSSTPSRSSPSACTRSCGACCRPTRSSRSTPAPRRPTATTACSSAGRRPSSRRSTSAVSASRFRSRWAPSLAGRRRRWSPSTATAATS